MDHCKEVGRAVMYINKNNLSGGTDEIVVTDKGVDTAKKEDDTNTGYNNTDPAPLYYPAKIKSCPPYWILFTGGGVLAFRYLIPKFFR